MSGLTLLHSWRVSYPPLVVSPLCLEDITVKILHQVVFISLPIRLLERLHVALPHLIHHHGISLSVCCNFTVVFFLFSLITSFIFHSFSVFFSSPEVLLWCAGRVKRHFYPPERNNYCDLVTSLEFSLVLYSCPLTSVLNWVWVLRSVFPSFLLLCIFQASSLKKQIF